MQNFNISTSRVLITLIKLIFHTHPQLRWQCTVCNKFTNHHTHNKHHRNSLREKKTIALSFFSALSITTTMASINSTVGTNINQLAYQLAQDVKLLNTMHQFLAHPITYSAQPMVKSRLKLFVPACEVVWRYSVVRRIYVKVGHICDACYLVFTYITQLTINTIEIKLSTLCCESSAIRQES